MSKGTAVKEIPGATPEPFPMSSRVISLNELPKRGFSPAPEVEHNGAAAPQTTTPAESEPKPPQSTGHRSRKPLLIGLPILLVVATTVGFWLHYAAQFVETDNAFIEADVHPVSSRVAGNIQSVLVEDNQQVEAGQPVAQLDPRDYEMKLQSARTALEQAAAQVPQADAALAQAQATSAQTEAQVNASAAQLEKFRLDFERAQKLRNLSGKAISDQDFDATKAAYVAAQASHASTQAARQAGEAGVKTAEANLAVAKAGQHHAQAAVSDAELQLSYTTVRAPAAGKVGKRTLQVGQQIQPGQALLAVVSPDHWLVANFKENQLATMKAGQPVEIKIDAIKGQRFEGRVESFAPGTGAKFSLLPPDNATGNFTKIVQRVPVKITFDHNANAEANQDRIAPGLSAIATVKVK